MNTIGYLLYGLDNGTYMFEPGDDALPKCSRCGYRVNFSPNNPDYSFTQSVKPLFMDFIVDPGTPLSITLDGQVIVSKSFKDFCTSWGYRGLTFLPFSQDDAHFQFIIAPQIEVDAVRGDVKFENLCCVCGNYESVTGGGEFFKTTEPLPDGFFRSDLLFASRDEKHPLIIVGVETRHKLEKEKFKDLDFEPIYGLELPL